jgi:hypothetical protein
MTVQGWSDQESGLKIKKRAGPYLLGTGGLFTSLAVKKCSR